MKHDTNKPIRMRPSRKTELAKATKQRRELVPIISASETSKALTREAAKELLLLETQQGG